MTYEEWSKGKPMTVREEGCARQAWDAAIEQAAAEAWSWGEDTLVDKIRAMKCGADSGKES